MPERTGIMSEGAMCTLGGMALAGEPADRMAAAEAVTNVIARHPEARDCLPPAVPHLADQLTQFARLALPPYKAIELAPGAKNFFTEQFFT